MDLVTYSLISFGYIILWQLALYMKNEMGFDFLLMSGSFVLGGVIGAYLQSYETGFVVAMILSFLFL